LLVSLKQLRQQTQLPICIASDLRMDVECDQFIWIAEPKFSSQDKMISLPMSPFSETIYIDSDMSFFSSPDPIFDGLQGADLLVSHEASLGLGPASVKAMITPVFPEVSTGLMAFRKTATVDELFRNWRAEYEELSARHGIMQDQPAFRRALFFTPVRFSILPPEYHYIPANFTRVVGSRIVCVHNHDFALARRVGIALNRRPAGDYAAYVDGLGVFRNPYAMRFDEALGFALRCLRLFAFLVPRALYISLKEAHPWAFRRR
jgi:hypothetical protein